MRNGRTTMPIVTIRSDGVLEKIIERLGKTPVWIPKLIQREIKRLGPVGTKRMQGMLGRNYYTGALMKSVQQEYKDEGLTVEISPTAQRGRWDAGLLLEFGTRPIVKCPYAPIARWAGAKGAPMPAAWLKIRTKGVSPHPFMDDTLNAVEPDLDKSAAAILDDGARAALNLT